jgi:hypothetical protein
VPPRSPKRGASRKRRFTLAALWIAALAGGTGWAAGCNGWDPRAPFERNAPEVDQALRDLDAGQLESAEETLERYLGTGECGDAGIGLPPSVRAKPNGSFDLGLTLFHMAERFGQRFGDEEEGDGGARDPNQDARRAVEVNCAQIIVGAIAGDVKVPIELRARAHYLAGNLEFLRRRYKEAVTQYDAALALVPGLYVEAGGDGIGRDAAHNRAIALRRLQEQEEAGADAPDGDDGSDAADGGDGGDGASPNDDGDRGDGGDDPQKSSGDDAGADGGKDAGGDAGGEKDGGDPASDQPDAGAPPPRDKKEPPPPQQQPSTSQDERMLDDLEQRTESYQKQESKNNANRRRRGGGMEDK